MGIEKIDKIIPRDMNVLGKIQALEVWNTAWKEGYNKALKDLKK